MMTKRQAEKMFIQDVLPHVKAMHETDGKPDYNARAQAWNDWTDALCKDRQITLEQYESWTCPRCCGK